jgi:tetratricopeptide (TPR) repeat protein
VQGAIAELDWALKLDPQDPKALACRAAVRIKQGNWQGAIADCNRAIQGGGADATLYRYRARARLEMGDRAGALADLDQALAQDDQNPLLWMARGDAQQALGNYSAAIGDYDRALELGGDRPAILLLRAQAAVRQENLKQAIEDYQTAASLFCDRNDWERYRTTLEQLKMLQQPVNLSPGLPQKAQNPLWQRLLGRVGGQEAIAQTLLDRAREHYPNMDEDWYLEKVLYDLERDDLPED